MKYSWGIFVFLLVVIVFSSCSRTVTGGKIIEPIYDSTAKNIIEVTAYFDGYYAFDFNEPVDANRPYSVSYSKHNNFSINQAFITVSYASHNTRAKITPAFGTYMNANYAREPMGFRNLMEASAGVKLSDKKNIWLDAGIMPSPITHESPVAADNSVYTRSLGAEFSPYYLTGIKLTVPVITKRFTTSLYIVNGWQQISDVNDGKSVLVQLEYKRDATWLANLNLWAGSERNLGSVQFRNRYFSDLYIKYAPKGKRISFTTGRYFGIQERKFDDSMGFLKWWNVNIAAKYRISKKFSLAGRAEYFQDKNGAVVIPVTSASEFKCSSFSLCGNYAITDKAMFRVETRSFFASDNIFNGRDHNRVKKEVPTSYLIVAGITVKF